MNRLKRKGRSGHGTGTVMLRLTFITIVNDFVQRLGPLDRRTSDALVA